MNENNDPGCSHNCNNEHPIQSQGQEDIASEDAANNQIVTCQPKDEAPKIFCIASVLSKTEISKPIPVVPVNDAKKPSLGQENIASEVAANNQIVTCQPKDEAPKMFCIASVLSNPEISKSIPVVPVNDVMKPSLLLRSTATQLQILSNVPSPSSINIVSNQPQSLFLQALSKLNESAINYAINAMSKRPESSRSRTMMILRPRSPELSTPMSLGSAPPSYSFVLKQMAVRRRPRMLGTFVPSPSFIQQAPPPTYAASFDIYLDNLPPPPARIYNFGFAPMMVVCPDCGFTGMTVVNSKITLCTHLCAIILCILCCWICAPLPYIMRSCKNVHHYCRNCRSFLGTYCPTNPESI